MKISRTALVAAFAVGVGFSVLPGALAETDYPTEAVTIVVPFPPGGGTDLLGRVVANGLSSQLGQPFVVENRPGAAGVLGATQVSRAEPDGYTLLMAATGAVIPPEGTDPADFDVTESFAPVALVAAPPYLLVVNPDVPAESVEELVELARAEPGSLNFASSGIGAASHLAGELFRAMAEIEIVHVPYRGMGQAVTDVLSGEVQMMFGPAPAVLSHVESGSLRVLAVTSEERSPLFPDYPTIAEAGVEGYEAVGWFGLFAPAGMPAEITEKLNEEVRTALATPEAEAQLENMGAVAADTSPEEFTAFINDDTIKWGELMAAAGIELE